MSSVLKHISMLLAVVVAAGAAWYTSTASVCPVPLTYRIGTIDEKFDLNQETARQSVEASERIWESATGRELFTYDEEGTLVIDFVYDERQEGTNAGLSKQTELDAKRKQMDDLQSEIDSLQKEYNETSSKYEGRVSEYEKRLAAYNEKVARYNDQGGAPSDVFEQLEKERKDLDATAKELGASAEMVNKLADTINQLGQKSNEFVESYNQEVEIYNQEFGFSKEFTQGDYLDGRINIYEFTNQAELETVLVHELGHALGLEHVEESGSIMYYLLETTSSSPVLSDADKNAFIALCGDGNETAHTIRSFIRNFLVN